MTWARVRPGVVGGQEVAADGHAEGEQAANLDLVGVGAERADRVAQQLHALVVDAAQAVGDGRIAASPVADGQVDGEQAVAREDEPPGQPRLVEHVAALLLDAVQDVGDALALPRVQHLRQQRAAVGEVAVEGDRAYVIEARMPRAR
jgi:hypothetical protein